LTVFLFLPVGTFNHATTLKAFDWGLRQAFPKRDIVGIAPVASPGMGGGLFAIDRALFFEVGGYDPEMKLYGGEEVEL
jgi:polypeptide N-acetylgalactosaminyltransferase